MVEKYQFFDGKRFTRDENTGYYLCSTENENKKRKRMHVYVWEYFNGPVPNGYHVHHIDGDKSNNDIKNLQMLPASEHEKLHGKMLTDEQKETLRRNGEKMLIAAKEWHRSDEGREWHRNHYKKMQEKLHVPRTFVCDYCKKEFVSVQTRTRFCSNKCKSAWRRKTGVDNITKICFKCGKEYIANKYQKTKYCPVCKSTKYKKNR